MQDLLNLILKNIVTNPDAIQVVVSNEEDREVYTINVDPIDMGRVIGKNGKVIKAIRALAHVVAIRQGKRFRINLADETGNVDAQENVTEATAEVVEATPAPKETVEEVADVIDLSPEKDSKAE